MRIAIRPIMITSPGMIKGDSNYVMMRDFCDYIEEFTDGKCFFYFLMADKYKGHVDDTDKIKHLFFPTLYYDFNHFQAYTPYLLGYLFNRRYGKLVCDAYVAESSAEMVGTDNILGLDDRKVPLFVDESKTMYPGFTHDDCDELIMAERAFGYTRSVNMFDSDVEMQLAIRLCRDHLKPNLVKKVTGNCHVIPCGINVRKLNAAVETGKNRKFTVFFGGRVNETKNTDKLLDILERAKILYDFEVNLTTQMQFDPEVKAKYIHFHFYDGVSSEKYIKMVSKAHVFLNASIHEGYSVGIAEALAAGTIVVLPERYWVTQGTYKGYPHVYDPQKPDTAIAIIKRLMDNYKQEYDEFDKFRQPFITENDRELTVQRMYNLMQSHASKSKYLKLKVDVLRDIAEKFKSEGLDEVYIDQFEKRYFGRVNKTGVDDPGCAIYVHAYPGRWDLYKCVVENGIAEDMYNNADVRLRLL